jgi:hypothetical protein
MYCTSSIVNAKHQNAALNLRPRRMLMLCMPILMRITTSAVESFRYLRIRLVPSLAPSPPLPPLDEPALSSSSSSSSSLQPSASRFSPRIPKDNINPMNATPANIPNASASPLGLILVDAVKRDPEMKGPTARPAAERVCARPFNVPRTLWFGAEFVIYVSG